MDALLADGTPIRVAARGEPSRPAAKADQTSRGRLTGISELVAHLRSRESAELASRIPRVLRHVAGYNLQRVEESGEGPR